MSDAEAIEHYDNPDNRRPEPGTRVRRPPRPTDAGPFARALYIRLRQDQLDAVRAVAEAEGSTVSTWVRQAVDEALQHRAGAGSADELATELRRLAGQVQALEATR